MSPDSRTGISHSSRLLHAGQRNCSTPWDLERCLKCVSMEQTEKPNSLSMNSWGRKGVNTMQSKHMGPYGIIRARKNIFRVWTGGSHFTQEQLEHWAKKQELCQVRSAKLFIYVVFLTHSIFSPILFYGNKHSFLLTNINIFSSCLLRDALF